MPESEIHSILAFCHSYSCGGHFGARRVAARVLQSEFFWPILFLIAHYFCLACEHYQRTCALSSNDMMPLFPTLFVEIFDVRGIDFMGLFPLSFGFVYILAAVDYVSKWVEALVIRTNDHKVVVKFVKEFCQYGTPKALISDGGSQFCRRSFHAFLRKYTVTHKVATPINPN